MRTTSTPGTPSTAEMTKIDLPYVQRFKDRHGRVRHYFRRPGFKRAALPGAPGSEDFMRAYQKALGGRAEVGAERSPPGSISALIAAYYQSADFKRLRASTQAVYRNLLDRFREEDGKLPTRGLRADHIKKMLDARADTPGAAHNLLKALRAVFRFGVDRGIVSDNPAAAARFTRPRSAGFRAWTDADIEAFQARWPEGSRARLALTLLLYTGVRRSDVVRLGRQHLRGEALVFRPKKARADAAELVIPLHPTLKAALAAVPMTNLTFLMTEYGKPMSEAGFTNWFADCAKKAGLPEGSTPHGLRKAAARRLAEAGCSTLEIAAITGHASLKEIERYTQSVRQAALATAAIARIANGDRLPAKAPLTNND